MRDFLNRSSISEPATIIISNPTREPFTIEDVTDESLHDAYGFRFNRRNGQFSSYATWTNTGVDDFTAQLWMVVEEISPPEVTLVKADGTTPEGKPYFDFQSLVGSDGILSSGETSEPKTVIFSNPSRIRFTYTTTFMAVKE